MRMHIFWGGNLMIECDFFFFFFACFCSAPVALHLTVSLPSPFPTERQHLGSVPDHLSRINTQQLAPGVQPLCTQIQGERLPQLLCTCGLSGDAYLCWATLVQTVFTLFKLCDLENRQNCSLGGSIVP